MTSETGGSQPQPNAPLPGGQWNFQQIVTVALLGIVILLLAANLLKSPPPVIVQGGAGGAMDRSAMRRDRVDKDGRKEEDPYLANQVKNTIVKNYIPVRDCWNAYIDTKPSTTEGKIMVDWQITLAGDVENPEIVSSDFANETLTQCLVDKIKEIKFPPPPYGQAEYVAHKFFFRKDDGSGGEK